MPPGGGRAFALRVRGAVPLEWHAFFFRCLAGRHGVFALLAAPGRLPSLREKVSFGFRVSLQVR